ncbi:hypothetical protein N7478_008885 [Penicillium angulare]|uniref:uncharacterized protein n=1 Tax=Penicillium angulare TaxID=116970 RepID=UPI00253F8109|nr:uncharacterized protein N7478_008885 [Penicillium angulare]KAJ5273760.1 hypothetical protein N7478_008885 [Penicillium angulare]
MNLKAAPYYVTLYASLVHNVYKTYTAPKRALNWAGNFDSKGFPRMETSPIDSSPPERIARKVDCQLLRRLRR